MYWLTKIVFITHLVIVVLMTVLNYVDTVGICFGNAPYVTIRGDVNIVEENWKPLKEHEQFRMNDSIGVRTIFLMKKSGFARIDYTDLMKVFTPNNILIIIFDIAHYWIWLLVSFQLMKIIASLKNEIIFDMMNVRRLKILAIAFGLAPILETVKNIMFANLLRSSITISHHFIWSEKHFMMYYGIGIMLLIFVFAEIFKYGLQLKNENDLTI